MGEKELVVISLIVLMTWPFMIVEKIVRQAFDNQEKKQETK